MPKTNSPFSATIQTTHEQKLVDGNAIHGLIITHQYRDSAGRVRGETSTLCNIGSDGKFHPNVGISIYDPATKTSMTWQVNGIGEKIARVHHQPDAAVASPPPPPSEEQRKQNAMIQEHWRKTTRNEKIGTRTIAGILCDGTRAISTIPAGEQGNEQPIESVVEIWTARDLGLTMLRTQDDPQSGRTVAEVTDLDQHEPDPALFQPPPGYKLEEQTTTKPVTIPATE